MFSVREILLLVFLIVLQLILMFLALLDLRGRERVTGPKWLWFLVIVFIGTLGPLAYLVFGRKD
ncbi:MAG: PLDc_N domain-containing protein [Firmicutes bacterium]|nr:PLDc_N domain-containing protein [Bacillota bacterium]